MEIDEKKIMAQYEQMFSIKGKPKKKGKKTKKPKKEDEDEESWETIE
jgi:hypothetical protein